MHQRYDFCISAVNSSLMVMFCRSKLCLQMKPIKHIANHDLPLEGVSVPFIVVSNIYLHVFSISHALALWVVPIETTCWALHDFCCLNGASKITSTVILGDDVFNG